MTTYSTKLRPYIQLANQATIEATSGYPTLWGIGAGKATVYFDL